MLPVQVGWSRGAGAGLGSGLLSLLTGGVETGDTAHPITSSTSTTSTPPVDTRRAKAAMDQLSLLDTLNLSYAGNMDISHAVTQVIFINTKNWPRYLWTSPDHVAICNIMCQPFFQNDTFMQIIS